MDSNLNPKKTNPESSGGLLAAKDTTHQAHLAAPTALGLRSIAHAFVIVFGIMLSITLGKDWTAYKGGEVFVVVLCLFVIAYYGRFAIAVPFKTMLDGNTITTKGYTGTHSVSLDTIVSVKRLFLLSDGRSENWYGLRIRDKSGSSVVIPFDALARAQQHTFCQYLYPALATYIDKDKKLQSAWQNWTTNRSNL